MSVIHEALKKTNTEQSGFRPELVKKKSRVNWGPLFVIAVLILITAPILAPIFRSSHSTYSAALPGKPSPNMKAQFSMEEAPLAPSMMRPGLSADGALPKFTLNGLVYSADGSYCLINGKVVKVGEQVGGATLEKVTPNEAVVNYNGQRIVLSGNA